MPLETKTTNTISLGKVDYCETFPYPFLIWAGNGESIWITLKEAKQLLHDLTEVIGEVEGINKK